MTGAVFQPELISLMKSILDEASAALPEAKRTSAIKADMASVILARASGVLALREISAGLAAARIVDVGRLNQNGPFGLEAFDCHHQ